MIYILANMTAVEMFRSLARAASTPKIDKIGLVHEVFYHSKKLIEKHYLQIIELSRGQITRVLIDVSIPEIEDFCLEKMGKDSRLIGS